MSYDAVALDNVVALYFLLLLVSRNSFAHNLVSGWNKSWVDAPTISDVEVALPNSNNCPQRLKGFGTMVAQHPP